MKVFTSDEILKIEAKTQALINMLNKDCNQGLEYMKLDSISTWEVDGKWKISDVYVGYTDYERDVVCEVKYQENHNTVLESMRIFLTQHQNKREYSEKGKKARYEYGNVKRVEPIKGKIINDKWVIKG